MSAKVWVLGDAVVDLLPESDGRLLPCPGGAPANVAVGIARLGGTSGFIGRVGDDPFGALMQRTLLTEGVDITYLKQDEFSQGAGLGLSICQGIVQNLGGRIALSSKQGEGSRFSVVLPVYKGG